MPKFIDTFKVVVPGDKYASDFYIGQECPKELIEEAVAAGVVKKPAKKAQ